MSSASSGYFKQLTTESGAAWNRFWFEPSHPATVGALRIVAGLATLWYLLSATTELTTLFANDGLLPISTVVSTMQSQSDAIPNYRFSLLYYLNQPALLWGFHLVSLAVALAYTLGFFSRVTNVITLIIMLSWVHRAPMLTGQFEPILTMLLLYLCFAPTGLCYTVTNRSGQTESRSWLATVSVRLIQIHLCMFYLMFALTKLGGQVWWGGGAAYLMIAQSESRLIDLTSLRESIFAINLATHAIVAVQLAYPILIWNRLLRPLVIFASLLLWIGIGLITGLISFALLMILINLAFIPGEWLTGCCGKPDTATT